MTVPAMTVPAALAQYETWCRDVRGLSPLTLGNLLDFRKYWTPPSDTAGLSTTVREHLIAGMRRRQPPLNPNTMRRICGAYHRFVEWCVDHDLAPVEALLERTKVRGAKAKRPVSDREAVNQFLAEVEDEWSTLFVLVLAECGLRSAEARLLRVKDVTDRGAQQFMRVTVQGKGTGTQEGPKMRTVPIYPHDNPLAARLRLATADRGDDEYLFPAPYRRCDSPAIKHMKERDLTPHMLRRMRACELAPILHPVSLMKFMGHESLRTTQLYLEGLTDGVELIEKDLSRLDLPVYHTDVPEHVAVPKAHVWKGGRKSG